MSVQPEKQTKLGAWTTQEKPTSPEYQDYANQVKTQAQEATIDGVGEFKKYEVTLFIRQVVAGMNYVVKVDTGNGDDKFVDVQFLAPASDPKVAKFTAAKQSTKDSKLHPLKD